MSDALVSPAVGGVMWAASAGLIAYSAKKIRQEPDDSKVPLMGVLGAFIFAAQMINFSIPGTGSSGHLGGGMILSVLLGAPSAFLTITSVLIIQALFFADGGLLALGCNIFNLGFFPAFIAYPLFYKSIVHSHCTKKRIITGSLIAAIIGLQLGAFSVVIETLASGISELSLGTFLLMMQPIHFGIGIVEGCVTAVVVLYVWRVRPEILTNVGFKQESDRVIFKRVIISLAAAALGIGVLLSWFASSHPDGLEWALAKTTGREEPEAPSQEIYSVLSRIQEKLSFLPDYSFKPEPSSEQKEAEQSWPVVDKGTSLSGFVGGVFVLFLAGCAGYFLKRRSRKT
jgi:cobalt/nickel transport system permease protein